MYTGRANSLCKRLEIVTIVVIGQKAQIGPNPFTPRGRADLVVWFFKLKHVCYEMAQAHWIGCVQNGGPILGLKANVIFH